VFSGTIQNSVSGSPLSVITSAGSGTTYFTGLNTDTGATILGGGQNAGHQYDCLTGGVASAIGMSGNAASNLVFAGGGLQYTGANAYFAQSTQTASVSTDRLFTLAAGSAFIDSIW
jgi:hypothetical protein